MTSRSKPPTRRKVGRPNDGENVRAAILAAALRQLEATGDPDLVTIAGVVDEAGCTPPSLYHYWPKRELLLQEASASGWAQFRASQTIAVADDHDPVERLRMRGRAYLGFALARPALFRVLFLEPPSAGPARRPDQPGEALRELIADVTAAMATGQLCPADPPTTALALWSAMHGVAALWAVTPNLPPDLAHTVGEVLHGAVFTGLGP